MCCVFVLRVSGVFVLVGVDVGVGVWVWVVFGVGGAFGDIVPKSVE